MAYVSTILDISLNLRLLEISFSLGPKNLEMVLNAKILILGSLALEMLKKNQSLTGLGNAGLGGSEEKVTLGPPSLSLLAVRPRYIIALLLLLRKTIMWYVLCKIRIVNLYIRPHWKKFTLNNQGGITCGAIDEPRKSSKAIDERVIINFRDKNVVIARFRDKNVYR